MKKGSAATPCNLSTRQEWLGPRGFPRSLSSRACARDSWTLITAASLREKKNYQEATFWPQSQPFTGWLSGLLALQTKTAVECAINLPLLGALNECDPLVRVPMPCVSSPSLWQRAAHEGWAGGVETSCLTLTVTCSHTLGSLQPFLQAVPRPGCWAQAGPADC